MNILTVPNINLRKIASDVVDFNFDLSETIKKMTSIMFANYGVGLAAPQVGILQRLIIVNSLGALINPKIINSSKEHVSFKEGCLSIPGKFVIIDRPRSIDVEFQDIDGKFQQQNFTGLESRIIQHEVDHLNGILMIDGKGI